MAARLAQPSRSAAPPARAQAFDFLIVGGGPAGAAAAGLLAAAGYYVGVCEQKPFPRPKVCGEFIGTQTRPVLARLGLLERFEARAGPPLRRLWAFPAQGPDLQADLPPDSTGARPRALSRDALDTLLLARAAELGATVLQPCHVIHVAGAGHAGFRAATSRGPLEARYLLLAHGLAQRAFMFPPDAPAPRAAAPPTAHLLAHPAAAYFCFKTHFTAAALPADTIALAGAAGLYAGLVQTNPPLSRQTLAFVVSRARLERLGPSPEAHLADLCAANPGVRRLLGPARRAGPWLSSGPLVPGLRTLYHEGRFALGNAAGEVHALVGEGITLALRSAALFADAVAQRDPALIDPCGLGQAYAALYRREFLPRCRAANLFAALMMRPSLAALAAAVLAEFPPVLDYCIRRSGKGPAAEALAVEILPR